MGDQAPFTLGEWRIDPLAHTIVRGDSKQRVPAKVMAVLHYLAYHQSRPVTRDELIEAIWDGNVLVGEKAVTNAIWRIRQAFGEEAEIVKTVPKTGYQLQLKPEFETAPEQRSNSSRLRRKLFPWLVVSLIVLFLFTLLLSYLWVAEEDPVMLNPEVLVEMPGRELYPKPSPDGRSIAFLAVSLTGERDIYLARIEDPSSPPRRMTFSVLDEISPAWSSDGEQLAFIRRDTHTGDCSVFVLDVASLEETRVNSCHISENDFDTLSWSPDGRWLVHRWKPEGGVPGLFLWAVDEVGKPLDSETAKRISCINCPYVDQEVSWSPDSSKMAVTRQVNRLSSDVFVYRLETGLFEQITDGERSIKGHAWHRDNRRLLYVANRGASDRNLHVIDTASGESRALGLSDSGFPAYLPGFDRLVFYRRTTDTHISSIPLQQTDGPTMAPAPVVQTAHAERSPAVDPARGRIAFISDLSGHEEIWTAGLDGSDPGQLTELNGRMEDPAWSPDGRSIAFISVLPGEPSDRIRLLDVSTGQVRTLKTDIRNFGAPSWSTDGQSIIVPARDHGQFNLWRIPIEGGSKDRLTLDGGEFGRESPRGTHVYFTRPDAPGFFRLDHSGRVEQVYAHWESRYGWANWDWLSDQELIYSEVQDDQIVLSKLQFEQGRTQALFALPLRSIHRHGRVSFSPHNNSIYFTSRELPQIDIWISNDPLSLP